MPSRSATCCRQPNISLLAIATRAPPQCSTIRLANLPLLRGCGFVADVVLWHAKVAVSRSPTIWSTRALLR